MEMNNKRQQSEFNMAVSYLNRMNGLFYICDVASIILKDDKVKQYSQCYNTINTNNTNKENKNNNNINTNNTNNTNSQKQESEIEKQIMSLKSKGDIFEHKPNMWKALF